MTYIAGNEFIFLTLVHGYFTLQTFYTKLGCKQDAWKALAVNAYSDKYCSEKLSSYNYQVDLSDIQVSVLVTK